MDNELLYAKIEALEGGLTLQLDLLPATGGRIVLRAPREDEAGAFDGRILKRAGKLAALDTPKVIAEARAALAGVRERAK
jgi:hypothetical protein